MASKPTNKNLPPLSFLLLPPSDKDLHYSQIPLPPSPAPSRSATSPGRSSPYPSSPSNLAFPPSSTRLGSPQGRAPPLTPLSPNFSRPHSYLPRESTSLDLLSSPLSIRPELLPSNRTALSPPRPPPPPPAVALKSSKSILRFPSFFRRPAKRFKDVVRSSSTPPSTTLPKKRLSIHPPLPTSPTAYTPSREHRMLAQSMLGSAFPAGAGGKDRMSQWRESVAPFASDPEGIERRGGPDGSRESSPAKQFMEEVLRDPKGSMGGWKFPTTPEKEETRVVEVVGWEEKGEKSRPAEEEDEFEFERTTTTSISDLPRTSLGTEPFPSPLNWTPQGYSSTPNLSLVLVESNDASSASGLYEPSSALDSLASPISLLSPTSMYTSPHTPSFPSSSNSSDDDGTRTPHQRLASAPPHQTSFARGRSPPSAKSKLHRITTFFDKPVKVVPEAAPRKGLGSSIVVMTPVEMARRMRELEEDEDQEASKRMESFYM